MVGPVPGASSGSPLTLPSPHEGEGTEEAISEPFLKILAFSGNREPIFVERATRCAVIWEDKFGRLDLNWCIL